MVTPSKKVCWESIHIYYLPLPKAFGTIPCDRSIGQSRRVSAGILFLAVCLGAPTLTAWLPTFSPTPIFNLTDWIEFVTLRKIHDQVIQWVTFCLTSQWWRSWRTLDSSWASVQMSPGLATMNHARTMDARCSLSRDQHETPPSIGTTYEAKS